MKFRVLGAQHAHGSRVYEVGDVFECDSDLSTIFRNKFEKVGEEAKTALGMPLDKLALGVSAVPTTIPLADSEKIQSKEEKPATLPGGKDVTTRFPEAVDADYKVFKVGNLFAIYDTDDLSKALASDLKKADIVPFIQKTAGA